MRALAIFGIVVAAQASGTVATSIDVEQANLDGLALMHCLMPTISSGLDDLEGLDDEKVDSAVKRGFEASLADVPDCFYLAQRADEGLEELPANLVTALPRVRILTASDHGLRAWSVNVEVEVPCRTLGAVTTCRAEETQLGIARTELSSQVLAAIVSLSENLSERIRGAREN